MMTAPQIVIGIGRDATIRAVEGHAASLRQALADSDRVEVDCSQIDEVDFSFVQLMLSALKTAEAENKALTLDAPARGGLLQVLTLCGAMEGSRRRFWFREESA